MGPGWGARLNFVKKGGAMRRRGCLGGFIAVVGLLVLCCAIGYFALLPRVQNGIRDQLAGEISTQVARQIDRQLPAGGSLSTGEYRITLPQLERQIEDNSSGVQIDSLRLTGDGDEIVLTIESAGQTVEYRGVPTVNTSGDLEMTGMTSNGGVLDYILAPDKLGQALSTGVNSYVGGQGFQLQDVRLVDNELVFDIVE